jgi:hypothetical protein
MIKPDIIGIANDKERNIRDYAVFDPSSMIGELLGQKLLLLNLNSSR